MKFIITMNMPSAKNFLVHQLTVENEANSCAEFCKLMNRDEFIVCKLLYRRTLMTGEIAFENRGDLILNTAHIGKVQEFYDIAKDYTYDEPYGHSEPSDPHFTGERLAVRKRRGNF